MMLYSIASSTTCNSWAEQKTSAKDEFSLYPLTAWQLESNHRPEMKRTIICTKTSFLVSYVWWSLTKRPRDWGLWCQQNAGFQRRAMRTLRVMISAHSWEGQVKADWTVVRIKIRNGICWSPTCFERVRSMHFRMLDRWRIHWRRNGNVLLACRTV